jgi:methyl-accepting chemotaxis protein
MLSFGVMIVAILGISYLALSSLNKANERVRSLYQEDTLGAIHAGKIAVSRKGLGRQAMDAMLNVNDPATVALDEKKMLSDVANLHANADLAEKEFLSKDGQDTIAIIQSVLPKWEKGYHDLYALLHAKDVAGAKALMDNLNIIGEPLADASDHANAIKQQESEQTFQANLQAYQSTRMLVLSSCALLVILAIVMSIVIARGFSVGLEKAVIALEQVAAGNLTVSLDVDTHDEVGRMATALNSAVERLNSTMRQVTDSAANASSSSQQLAAASEAISSGAQEQAASLEETSASLEEITAAVRQSADNAQQASQLAAGSKDSALQGQEVVSKAITAMSDINDASAKISDIISTIDEIAFQTNLLAVNAAVEAARAGDEGRGFAVVATEVRSLAQRSAIAAKEIKVLIQDTLHKVEVGSALVNHSGETLQGIVGSVKRVTDIVSEIAAASLEQSTGIEQVNTAMTQMDQVTQSNSAQTEELSATAESLSEQSGQLLELISAFTLGSGDMDVQPGARRVGPAQHNKVGVSRLVIAATNGADSRNRIDSGHSKINKARTSRTSGAGATVAVAANDSSFEEF